MGLEYYGKIRVRGHFLRVKGSKIRVNEQRGQKFPYRGNFIIKINGFMLIKTKKFSPREFF